MNTINELIERAHSQAKAMGWWDQPRNIGELLMLIVSECGEALEAHRSGRFSSDVIPAKNIWMASHGLYNEPYGEAAESEWFKSTVKDSFEDKLADIVIRIADLCGWNGWNNLPTKNVMAEENGNVGEQLLEVVSCIIHSRSNSAAYAMADAVSLVFGIAKAHNIDLWKHIDLKLKYNLTRGKKHGKNY